jgi:hypothetical protein
MNFERADEHLRMLRSHRRAEIEDSLAECERLLAEAIAEGKEGSRLYYEERVDRLKARRIRLQEQERGAA